MTGASPSETGLSPSGSSPQAVSPAVAASIPSADHLRVVASRFEPKDFEPFVKQAADSLYERIMQSCEDYLRENVEWNIGSHISMLEHENQRMRTELWEVDRALGGVRLGHDGRVAAIKERDRDASRYAELLYCVEIKVPGEGRHETARRMLLARNGSASAMSAFGQDPQGLEAKPASAVRDSGDAQ